LPLPTSRLYLEPIATKGVAVPQLSDERSDSLRSKFKFMAWVLGPFTALALIVSILMDFWVPLMGAVAGWVVLAGYFIIEATAMEKAGGLIGSILVPRGSSTPPAKGLSHIQAMVARGQYAEAAEAYRREIATDPADLASCEQLGLLATRELRDYPLALEAYREAEKRAETPARKFAFGMMIAGLYRDQLQDARRAVVELSRVLSLYPGAPGAAAAKRELEELKATIHGDRA
jgi:tetratricopeptide (TPR) repeat protein